MASDDTHASGPTLIARECGGVEAVPIARGKSGKGTFEQYVVASDAPPRGYCVLGAGCNLESGHKGLCALPPMPMRRRTCRAVQDTLAPPPPPPAPLPQPPPQLPQHRLANRVQHAGLSALLLAAGDAGRSDAGNENDEDEVEVEVEEDSDDVEDESEVADAASAPSNNASIENPMFAVGDAVYARWKAPRKHQMFRGWVAKVDADNCVDVRYYDGDFEKNVKPCFLARVPASTPRHALDLVYASMADLDDALSDAQSSINSADPAARVCETAWTYAPELSPPAGAANVAVKYIPVVRGLRKDKAIAVFHNRVHWKDMHMYDYPRVVLHPMDLGTILIKLHEHAYPTTQSLRVDMELVYDNCLAFNTAASSDWIRRAANQYRDRVLRSFDYVANGGNPSSAAAASKKRKRADPTVASPPPLGPVSSSLDLLASTAPTDPHIHDYCRVRGFTLSCNPNIPTKMSMLGYKLLCTNIDANGQCGDGVTGKVFWIHAIEADGEGAMYVTALEA